MKNIIIVLTFAVTASVASAGSVLPLGKYRPRFDLKPQSASTNTVAFEGIDVVAYRSTGKKIKGDARYAATVRTGQTFLFVSEEHRSAFLQNPDRFASTGGRVIQ